MDSYLARIGLAGKPDWTAMHRAHATSIPFENLDPATGMPVNLAPDHLETKLVTRQRGGYCFEHNLLFMAALESLGINDVTLMLARVRQGNATAPRPRSHLVLRVVVDGTAWLADVGFGGDTLLAPLPFGAGHEVEQSGWVYRTVEDGKELVLQIWRNGAWLDLYGFVPEAAERIDIEVANWFTSTHPRSPFVSRTIVSAQQPGVRHMLMVAGGEASLREQTPDGASVHPLALAAVPDCLATTFGLRDVPLPAALSGDGARAS